MSRKTTKPNVVTVIPVYKMVLPSLEQFSVDYSLSILRGSPICFVAPKGLDCSYYLERYPQARIEHFADAFFISIESYSRLLLKEEFYRRFDQYEFMLLLQPDAIAISNDLDFWTRQPFDYIGAPWPKPLELTVRRDHFKAKLARRVRATVGNGGFSLRRISKCIGLISEFPEMNAIFSHNGTNEDGFFCLLGALSRDFVLPNEIIASRFAMELEPEYYFSVNGNQYPMGVHAWALVNPKFWVSCVPPLAAVY